MATYDFTKGETFVATNIDFQKGETIIARPRKTRPGVPFWADKPAAWDTVLLANRRLPGIARLSGDAIQQRLDKQKTPGLNGAHTKLMGYEPAEFDVVLTLWTEEHLRTYESLVPLLKPKYPVQKVTAVAPTAANGFAGFGGIKVRDESGDLITYEQFAARTQPGKAKAAAAPRGPSAIDIQHPNLSIYGIRAAIPIKVGFLEAKGESGIKEVKLRFLEFNAKRDASVQTPSKSVDFTAGIRTALSTKPPPRRERPSDNLGP